MNRKRLLIGIIFVVIIAGAMFAVFAKNNDPSTATKKQSTPKQNQKPVSEQPGFNKKQHSVDDPTSIWVVTNKLRPLQPKNYKPTDLVIPDVPLRVPGHETMYLRREAATALEQLFAGAKTDGLILKLSSGFRSYDYQVNLYNGYVNSQGRETADTQSARPGYSEHQTGLAVDVRPTNGECDLEQCFGDMAEGQWVAANAYKYGFIIRYTKDNAQIAGYSYEPWHLRYVGIPLATELHNKNISTLEEFFGLDPAPDYSN